MKRSKRILSRWNILKCSTFGLLTLTASLVTTLFFNDQSTFVGANAKELSTINSQTELSDDPSSTSASVFFSALDGGSVSGTIYYSMNGQSVYLINGNESTTKPTKNTLEGKDLILRDTFDLGNTKNCYVTKIEENSFGGLTTISGSLTFSSDSNSHLTNISGFAFESCANLTSVSFPTSVSSIEKYAFASCTNLCTVNFDAFSSEDESSQTIGESAFASCTNLSTINMSKSHITTIDNSAFAGDSKIDAVPLASTTTSLGDSAFASCSAISSVDFSPTNISQIGAKCFDGCDKISSINLSGKLKVIGNSAFASATNISTLDLSSNLATIGPSAFSSAKIDSLYFRWKDTASIVMDKTSFNPSNLSAVYIPFYDNEYTDYFDKWFDNSSTWTSWTNVSNITFYPEFSLTDFFSGDGLSGSAEIQTTCKNGKLVNTLIDATKLKGRDITINDKINAIADNAFKNNNDITGKLIIASGVTSIGASAFDGCVNLTGLDLSSSTNLLTIASLAFQSCTGLKQIIFSSSITSLGTDIFNGDKNVEKIDFSWDKLPSSTAFTSSFNGFSTQNVNLPEWLFCDENLITSFKSWGLTGYNDIFSTFENPSTLYVSASNWNPGSKVIMRKARIDNNVTEVYQSENFSVKNLQFGTEIAKIAANAFKDNTNICGTLTIPSNVSSIGDNAFSGCTNIKEIDFSETDPSKLSYSVGDKGWLTNCYDSISFIIPFPTLDEYEPLIKKWTNVENPGFIYYQSCDAHVILSGGNLSGSVLVQPNNDGVNTYTITDARSLTGKDISFISKSATITQIAPNAFANNEDLSGSITIPDSITTIGTDAFFDNNFSYIYIEWADSPSSRYIGENCFSPNTYCPEGNLTLAVLPECMSYYTTDVLNNMGLTDDSRFEQVVGYTNDASQVFDNYTQVTSGTYILGRNDDDEWGVIHAEQVEGHNLKIKDDIEWIASGAFMGNASMYGNLYLPSTINHIYENAFYNCTSINGLYLYGEYDTFSTNSLSGILYLNFVYVDVYDGSGWSQPDTSEFKNQLKTLGIDTTDIYYIESNYAAEDIFSEGLDESNQTIDIVQKKEIPNPLYVIVDGTRIYGTNLVLNDSVVGIADSAFANNLNLKGSIYLTHNVDYIGSNVFNGCSNLSTIYLNWTEEQLASLNAITINSDWLNGVKNNPGFEIVVPHGLKNVYQQYAKQLGIEGVKISDGSTSSGNLALILGLSLGIGIPVVAGTTIGIVFGAKKSKKSKTPH